MQVAFDLNPATPQAQSGDLNASWPDLLHAAVTVGHRGWRSMTHYGLSALHQARWRSGAIRAIYAVDQGRLCRTALYKHGLDPTEKGMASYIGAMTTALTFARRQLGVAWLVHLDQLLAEAGLPLQGRRPDLVGSRRDSTAVAVEVKGRSGGRDLAAVAEAKKQLLSGGYQVLDFSHRPADCFVHHSYFVGDELRLHVEDPPTAGADVVVDRETLRSAFYDNVFSIVAASEDVRSESRLRYAVLEGAGVAVGFDERLESAFETASAMPRRPVPQAHGEQQQVATLEEFADLYPEGEPEPVVVRERSDRFSAIAASLPAQDADWSARATSVEGFRGIVHPDGLFIGLDERWGDDAARLELQ